MEFRIVFLCIATVTCQKAAPSFYQTEFAPSQDQRGENTNANAGFVEPIDFAAISQQFFGGPSGALSSPFTFGDVFGAESKTPQPFKNLAPFEAFAEESRQNSTGFVQPLKFVSVFDGQGASSEMIYRPNQRQRYESIRAVEDEENEEEEALPPRPASGPKKVEKLRENYNGKSSYPAPEATYSSEQHLYPSSAEVEVFYPKGRAILPTKNGRPKPYDGYRAATEEELRHLERPRPNEQRDAVGRFSERTPQVAYGRNPSQLRAVIQPFARLKRSAEAPEPTKRRPYRKKDVVVRPEAQQTQQPEYRRPIEEKSDSQEQGTGESEEYSAEQEEEYQAPETFDEKLERYKYENSFNVPELKIKSYPFERMLKKRQSKRQSPQESVERDEFTDGYWNFKESLPSDLEKFYGASQVDEQYSVAGTENLQSNSNCEKVQKLVDPEDIKEGKAKRDVSEKQVCYVCKDPKTGGSYEQCAYETNPQQQKYFIGGTTSFSTKQETEPKSYRYRRSLFDLDKPFDYEYYFYEDPSGKRVIRQEPNFELHSFTPSQPNKPTTSKLKKKTKRKTQKGAKKEATNSYKQTAKLEEPPQSYNGPAYTYEGPKYPYEDPAQPYEGPAEHYEGPNQEYYDLTDEKFGDYQYTPPKSLKYQTAPSKNSYHSAPKTARYTQNYNLPSSGPKSEVEEFQGGEFRASPTRYNPDYRFGPELFDDDILLQEKTTNTKASYKAPGGEVSSASSGIEEKEPFSGNVKIYKNGDVCEKKKKDNMICMECKNSKTGGTYEQCQYSTQPKEKYYTFGRAKSYSSGSPSQERTQRNAEYDQFPEKSDLIEKKIMITKTEVFGDTSPEELVQAESRNYNRFQEYLKTGDLLGSYSQTDERSVEPDTEAKKTETVEQIEPRDRIPGLDEYLYGGPDEEGKESETYKSYDDYFHYLFPEFAKAEAESEKYGFDPFSNLEAFRTGTSDFVPVKTEEVESEGTEAEASRLKDQPSKIPPEFFDQDDEHKKNLERAFGDFKNRDWSKCKKIEKNKLTCYQCVDKNGMNNEECMYVEESQPVSKHLAYHEKKDFKPDPVVKVEAETQNQPSVVPANATTAVEDAEATATPQETVQSEKYVKGDFQDVERSPPTTTESTTTTEEVTTTEAAKLAKKKQKKRVKTVEAETTTTEKPRKRRKHPVKKFNKEEEKKSARLEESEVTTPGPEDFVKIVFNATAAS